jgi:inner membrane protein
MATCFSHPAVPLAIACWFPSLRRPSLLVAASLLSAAPDLDAIGYFAGVPYEAWCGHRGCTHSIVFAALVAAALTPWLARRSGTARSPVFWFLFAAWASHGLIDMATNGGHGIAVLWPLSDERLFWPWQPIEVAPLGIRAFFSEWGIEVLLSEAVWLWLPALVIGAVGLLLRRRGGDGGGADVSGAAPAGRTSASRS